MLIYMKALSVAAIVVLLAISVQSQVERKLFPITEDAKFGFADANGKVVINTQYDMVSSFHDGLAMIQVNGKRGYINLSGKTIVTPRYDEAGDFSEGYAVVSRDYRWGYINVVGKEVIPLQFIEAHSFSDGLAAVYIQNSKPGKDSQWGYIDGKGKVVISPRFYKAFDFHNGIAKVIVGKFGEDNEQGFIDNKGILIIRPQYELTGEYSEGLIPVEIGGKTKKFGERLYEHISGKWGFIDVTGKLVIPATFNNADEFSEGLANVTIGDRYGYIDMTGKMVIAPQFEFSSNAYRCANFVEGRACFERDEKIGFIDKQGKVVIEPQFDFATKFSNGIAQVNFGAFPGYENERFPIHDNYGLIDLDGRVIYKPRNKNSATPKSVPADPAMYAGWRWIQEDIFSFYAPKDLKGGEKRGIDTAVYRYESSELTILFDIGGMANPLPVFAPHKVMTIDGQTASIWHSGTRSHLHVALGANFNKSQFNMYIDSKNPGSAELAEKMFTSLRFK